jgi:hypothetical protein
MSRSLRLARLLISSLEDRISLLSKKYPSVPEPTIRELASLDPTHGSLLEWLTRQVKSGQFRFPEDSFRMSPALSTFLQLKKSPRLLQQHSASPDINKYTFHSLESLHDKISGVELKSQRQTIEESKSKGTKTIYDTPPYKVIQIGGPGVPLDLAVQAACTYAKHTRWCTSKPHTAEDYLDQSPLYVIFKNGKKIAQTDGEQVMDLQDKRISIARDESLWKLLKKLEIITPDNYAYLFATEIVKGPYPEGEPLIAKTSYYAYYYAKDILKAPFPMGEPAIATSNVYSYYYANLVLHAPFPLGEPAIAANASTAYEYAAHVLHAPFPMAEPEISQYPNRAFDYAKNVLHAPFPMGEPTIFRFPEFRQKYLELFPSRASQLRLYKLY